DIESTDEINRNASVSATPTSISPLPTLEISTSTENSSEPSASTETPLDSTNRINDSAANILSSQQGASDQLDCNELLLNGFQELAKGNKTTATDYFQKAKKLNGCDCITLETILKMISEE
ncbi:MAG: hypothetical protein MJZ76_07855, partial [Bacteroidales bacterium]|nr:hypothetical protein [Bacteroidales bacterium]